MDCVEEGKGFTVSIKIDAFEAAIREYLMEV